MSLDERQAIGIFRGEGNTACILKRARIATGEVRLFPTIRSAVDMCDKASVE